MKNMNQQSPVSFMSHKKKKKTPPGSFSVVHLEGILYLYLPYLLGILLYLKAASGTSTSIILARALALRYINPKVPAYLTYMYRGSQLTGLRILHHARGVTVPRTE